MLNMSDCNCQIKHARQIESDRATYVVGLESGMFKQLSDQGGTA